MPKRSDLGRRLLEHPGWAGFLARFILTRSHQSNLDSETHFSNTIRRVVDKIIENKGRTGDPGRLRIFYVTRLCTIFQDATNLSFDTHTNDEVFKRVLLVAAIYFNTTPLVDSLIEQPLRKYGQGVWCSLLHAAVCTDDFDSMQRLTELGETWDCKDHRIEGRSVLDEVVPRPELGNTMMMLSEQGTEFSSMWGSCKIREYWIAACSAIELKRFTVAYRSFEIDWERWKYPNRIDIQILVFKALIAASKEQQFGLIRKILDTGFFFQHDGTWEVQTNQSMAESLRRGREAVALYSARA